MRTILIVLLTLVTTRAIACDCKKKALKQNQIESYERAQLIIIGDVIEFDSASRSYKIRIAEILKGSSKDNIISGITPTSCSGYPNSGRWIIYADSFSGGVIEFSSCGMSRSFSDPHSVNVKEYSLPTQKKHSEEMKSRESTDTYLNFLEEVQSLQSRALADLRREIQYLRRAR
jgi:hypothetical protein